MRYQPSNIDSIESEEFSTLKENEEGTRQTFHNNRNKNKRYRVSQNEKKKIVIRKIFLIFILVLLSFIYFSSSNKLEGKNKNQIYRKKKQISQAQKLKMNINEFLKKTRYYDIYHFTNNTFENGFTKVIQTATRQNKKLQTIQRKLLKINRTQTELELVVKKMKNPTNRPQKLQYKQQFVERYPQQIDTSYFFYQLNSHPNSKVYLEAQFYRYDKIYNIGSFGDQLPLCIVTVGKNNYQSVERMYDSIRSQNYTNYKIVHVDDNSDDETVKKIIQYVSSKPDMKERLTVVTQLYQKNALFNRDSGVTNYCEEDDIVIDMDADDWLIGNQVFQLVNSLYQTGNIWEGKREELWCAYFSNIMCCPFFTLYGQVPLKYIEKQTYRSEAPWRTTQLRTYLWKLYNKIDRDDYIDPFMPRKGQFHVESYDMFKESAMLQMSAPKHIKYLDQFLYYYTNSPKKQVYTELAYSLVASKAILPYQPLNNLQDKAEKNQDFLPNQKVLFQLKQRTSQIILKRQALKLKFSQILNSNQQQLNQTSFDKIEQRKVFMGENEGKPFGQSEQFYINVTQLGQPNRKIGFDYATHGIETSIQVASQYDYVNISRAVNFTQLEQELFKSLTHQILAFNYNQSLNMEKQQLFQYQQFKSQQGIQAYIDNLVLLDLLRGTGTSNFQFYLGSRLAMPYLDRITLQMEYYYYNRKYNIGENMEQLPFCIFSSGYNLFSQKRHKGFFNSIQRMNYTNYKIIWVDDYSNDNSAYQIYEYLRKSDMKLKNKIKIIHNLQHVGIMGNIHMHIKHYCGQNDIILIVDGDDSLIGTQTFKILNKIYQNPDYWLVHSKHLVRTDMIDRFKIFSDAGQVTIPVKQYRVADEIWTTSHLRTFRKKVLDAIPIEHFIEYHYNKETGLAYPHYYGSSADRFQVYSCLQVCGNAHAYFITDYFYNYDFRTPQTCYRNHELFDQYKSRIKIPLEPLTQDSYKSKIQQEYEAPLKMLDKLAELYPQHVKCQKKI